MKTKVFWLGIVFLFLGNTVSAETLNLVTEDYPPFNMRVNGQPTGNADNPLTGIAVDIVKELFKRAGIDYTVKIYSWERAYNTALETPGYGVFCTFRTSEREPLFQWVGPFVLNNWILMAKKSRNIKITSLEDARKYKIGDYRGDAIAGFLEKEGFPVEYTILDHLNARKLEGEKIDLWATGSSVGPYLAKREGISGLETVFQIKEHSMFLALNKSVSPDLVANLNKHFQDMKDDGTVEKIYSNYR